MALGKRVLNIAQFTRSKDGLEVHALSARAQPLRGSALLDDPSVRIVGVFDVLGRGRTVHLRRLMQYPPSLLPSRLLTLGRLCVFW